MTKQVQRRRGTATQHTSFTGAEGELSVNTTNKSVHVHDGATAGGIELARKDGSNVAFTSGTLDGVTIGGTTAGAGTFTNLTATGTTTLAGASTSADITFGDNDKAIFGAGSDLQIYHDGSNSYIDDVGTGDLRIRGGNDIQIRTPDDENYIVCNQNDSVQLFFDAAPKLATTSTGVDITGTLTSDGLTMASGSQAVIGVFGTSGLQLIGQTGSDNIVGTMGPSEPLIFRTSSSERMRIDSSGNVGIGNSSPSSYHSPADNLVLGSSGDNGLTIVSGTSSGGTICFADGTSGGAQYAGFIDYQHNGDYMRFGTNIGTERMRIDSSGRVMINTTTQKGYLTVNNNGNNTGIFIDQTSSTVNQIPLNIKSAYATGGQTAVMTRFLNTSDATVGTIESTTSSTSYNTTSDYRLKENVVELTGATNRLKQLEPKRFNFIVNPDTTVDGFIAHEVQSVVPEAITGTHNEVDDDGNPVYQGIDQSKLVPLLVATIKELEARITALENA